MDQLTVDSAVGTLGTSQLRTEFATEFPLLVNYVARLTDDLDAGPTIACATYRHFLAKQGDRAQDLSRVLLFKRATEMCQQWQKPGGLFGRRRRSAHELLEGFPQPEARRALRRDTLQRALSAVPFDARALVLLRDFVHFPYDDLVQITGISSGKLVHALDSARRQLQEIYAYIKF